MDTGKTISQGCHASLGAFLNSDVNVSKIWLNEGAKKIVVKVNSLKELQGIYRKVKKERIPCFLVRDAGLTQLKADTVTALGIGPAEDRKIDKMTGKLKLL